MAALTACNGKRATTGSSTPAPTPTPDAAALAAARRGELDLLAAYDRKIKHTALHRRGPLQVERAIHETHLSALHGVETDHAKPPASIQHELLRSATLLRRLSLSATNGTNAALLASIAASHMASAT